MPQSQENKQHTYCENTDDVGCYRTSLFIINILFTVILHMA